MPRRRVVEPMSEAQLENVRALIASREWVQAKSERYQLIPHQYTKYLGTKEEPDQGFKLLVEAVKRHGVREAFGTTSYVYLYVDEWKYWRIFPILNRALIADRNELKVGPQAPQPGLDL